MAGTVALRALRNILCFINDEHRKNCKWKIRLGLRLYEGGSEVSTIRYANAKWRNAVANWSQTMQTVKTKIEKIKSPELQLNDFMHICKCIA